MTLKLTNVGKLTQFQFECMPHFIAFFPQGHCKIHVRIVVICSLKFRNLLCLPCITHHFQRFVLASFVTYQRVGFQLPVHYCINGMSLWNLEYDFQVNVKIAIYLVIFSDTLASWLDLSSETILSPDALFSNSKWSCFSCWSSHHLCGQKR